MNQMIAMEITFDTRIEDLMKRYDQYLNLQKPVEYKKKISDQGSATSYTRKWNQRTILLNRQNVNREHAVIEKIMGLQTRIRITEPPVYRNTAVDMEISGEARVRGYG